MALGHSENVSYSMPLRPEELLLMQFFGGSKYRADYFGWGQMPHGLLRLLLHQIETGAGIVALGAALLSVHSCSRFPASAQEAPRQMVD